MQFFPKTEKYVSLFTRDEDSETVDRRNNLRKQIKDNLVAAAASGKDLEGIISLFYLFIDDLSLELTNCTPLTQTWGIWRLEPYVIVQFGEKILQLIIVPHWLQTENIVHLSDSMSWCTGEVLFVNIELQLIL